MILAIDIGNTQATLGALDGDRVAHSWRLSTRAPRTADEQAVFLRGCFDLDGVDPRGFTDAVIGSVVTHLTPVYAAACERLFGRAPLIVNGHTPMPVRNGYADPAAVGVDRLANAVAGVRRYGCPLIVVDFGTAITLDVISADNVYLGGVIAPGPDLMAKSLSSGTSRLPRIVIEKPASAIGRHTRDSVNAGVFYGIAGAVESLVVRISRELGVSACKTVATGGLAPRFAPEIAAISACEPFLTLFGLKEIQEYQSRAHA